MKKIGLLVMAYGTPRNVDGVEPYYTHIRRGSKPSQEALQDLISRYEAIGGVSPLAKITNDQGERLKSCLNERHDDVEFHWYLGLKHIDPFIEDAVQNMKEDGIEEAYSIVLAPHFSTFSIKSYNGRAQEETKRINGPVIHSVESWYDEPKFIHYWVEQVKQTMEKVNNPNDTCVIFSAHSLPEKILQDNDPYPKQLEETADWIAKGAGIPRYAIGWQSEGNTPDPWLGPDVQDLTKDLYQKEGYKAFVYCPVGFVSDHLEVLYDNDIECRDVCDELGVSYYRPNMPNTDSIFIDALADAVTKKMDKFSDEK
ncbi:ferrochelatase [Alteribacillus persepolensis]|uniref:Coproporphyrin III ferrochelatase n=1 Tax=Alteribacillus persepolensis TaxID=568899 RepID=A0A1G8DFE8_9BACI|nr:ferrochelatase [Alteribacillus persepolensis]SDH56412.1 ferrochelatase [Alteribacillus persepolensis]